MDGWGGEVPRTTVCKTWSDVMSTIVEKSKHWITFLRIVELNLVKWCQILDPDCYWCSRLHSQINKKNQISSYVNRKGKTTVMGNSGEVSKILDFGVKVSFKKLCSNFGAYCIIGTVIMAFPCG